MKKIILLGITVLLNGCLNPANQLINNKFIEVKPSISSVSGIWTFSSGPNISTIKLYPDGSGIICDDISGNIVFNKVKYANNMIYIQNGMVLEVKLLNKDILKVRTILSASTSNMIYKAD